MTVNSWTQGALYNVVYVGGPASSEIIEAYDKFWVRTSANSLGPQVHNSTCAHVDSANCSASTVALLVLLCPRSFGASGF